MMKLSWLGRTAAAATWLALLAFSAGDVEAETGTGTTIETVSG